MSKCKQCNGVREMNYGPNKSIDPSGADVIGYCDECSCPFCGGSGIQKQYVWENNVRIEIDSYSCSECNKTGVRNDSIFTCNKCIDKDICDCAWDAYNINGDCLASK